MSEEGRLRWIPVLPQPFSIPDQMRLQYPCSSRIHQWEHSDVQHHLPGRSEHQKKHTHERWQYEVGTWIALKSHRWQQETFHTFHPEQWQQRLPMKSVMYLHQVVGTCGKWIYRPRSGKYKLLLSQQLLAQQRDARTVHAYAVFWGRETGSVPTKPTLP